jgi:hypothetical protein
LIGLLKNSRIHIEFYFKLFIVIKHELKNEIIKLNVKSFFVKPSPYGRYEFLKGQNWTLFSKVLLK